eukprot:TRINITY_DN223_c0_g1_i2.p1 TRINITY_DN223_c0_g1~~TRINITY_DN223_c0_g1_i2.p1  ORF type:complete len:194 (+),score=114.38 TRINITY_DN223_c0_g1_i2:54-635(+)
MSQTGTVKSWRGAYGFAEMKDGTLVYIHTDEIDGGRLRVGMTVSFDTEAVEGHEGRVKGTNVSGEAVLAKGQKLSDEDMEKERERLKKLRDEKKEELQAEFAPVWDQVKDLPKNQKAHLVRELAKELGLKMQKPEGKVEKRADPTQRGGQTYTKEEFFAFYGKADGVRMWNAASKGGKKGGKRGPRKAKEEKK